MEYVAVSIYIESCIATCLTKNIIMIGGLCCQKQIVIFVILIWFVKNIDIVWYMYICEFIISGNTSYTYCLLSFHPLIIINTNVVGFFLRKLFSKFYKYFILRYVKNNLSLKIPTKKLCSKIYIQWKTIRSIGKEELYLRKIKQIGVWDYYSSNYDIIFIQLYWIIKTN
jgi:hypothetical protein